MFKFEVNQEEKDCYKIIVDLKDQGFFKVFIVKCNGEIGFQCFMVEIVQVGIGDDYC